MGTTRKLRKKYVGPSHPWRASRIAEETSLQKEYGLKNKKEIWRARAVLRKFMTQTKVLISNRGTKQGQLEEKQMMARLSHLGLLQENAKLEEVLALNVRNILDRRLQTLVHKQAFSLTPTQARQFITHGHITINGKKVDVPSFLVPHGIEFMIAFNPNSTIAKEDHPERSKEKKNREKNEVKEVPEEIKELKELEIIEKTVGAEVVQ